MEGRFKKREEETKRDKISLLEEGGIGGRYGS